MNGWQSVALSDLAANEADSFVDGPFGSDLKTSDYVQAGVPLVRIQNVKPNRYVSKDIRYVSERKARQLARHGYRPGDLVITKLGDPCGVACVVPEEAGSGLVVADIVRFRGNPERVSHSYLCQFINSPPAIAWIAREAKGTTRQRVNLANFKRLPVPLPALAEQRRIAEILDKADALRAKRRAALAQLDTLTKSIFLDMFGDPASHKRRFPVQPLEAVLKQFLQNGAYFPKESYTELGGVEMVHMSDAFYEVVPRGQLKRVVCAKSDVEKYALSENDILIARRSLTLEGAAKPCLIPKSSEPLIFESSFIRVTPDPNKLTALYLYHYLGNERVKQKCVKPFITQSTISGINQSNLERVPVMVPPLPLQREFGCRVAAADALKTEHRSSLANLDKLFASLQHRAFSGAL